MFPETIKDTSSVCLFCVTNSKTSFDFEKTNLVWFSLPQTPTTPAFQHLRGVMYFFCALCWGLLNHVVASCWNVTGLSSWWLSAMGERLFGGGGCWGFVNTDFEFGNLKFKADFKFKFLIRNLYILLSSRGVMILIFKGQCGRCGNILHWAMSFNMTALLDWCLCQKVSKDILKSFKSDAAELKILSSHVFRRM